MCVCEGGRARDRERERATQRELGKGEQYLGGVSAAGGAPRVGGLVRDRELDHVLLVLPRRRYHARQGGRKQREKKGMGGVCEGRGLLYAARGSTQQEGGGHVM